MVGEQAPQGSAMQPLLEKTVRWLEAELRTKQDKIPFETHVYLLKALRLASRDILAPSKSLLEKIRQDFTLKITVLVDMPRKDPEAFLELYELALGFDPQLAEELRTTVTEDIRKLQLQDGSIIGEHVQLAHVFYALNPKDPAALAAIKHTSKLFGRLVKTIRDQSPSQLYPYVRSLSQAGLLDEQTSNSLLDGLLVKQNQDGGWGDTLETLYAIRLLVLTNTLVAGERINRALQHIQAKLGQDGSLGDPKTTALYVIAHHEYMASGGTSQGFESSGLLLGTSTYTLKQLLVAAIRRAQKNLVAVNLKAKQLVDALLSALETTPTLEVLLIYSGKAEEVPETFKEPNSRVKLRLVESAPAPMLLVDRRLIVFTNLDDQSLSQPKAFAVKVFDPALAEKLAELLYRELGAT